MNGTLSCWLTLILNSKQTCQPHDRHFRRIQVLFYHKKTKMRTIISLKKNFESSTMFGKKIILTAESKNKRKYFKSRSCEETP